MPFSCGGRGGCEGRRHSGGASNSDLEGCARRRSALFVRRPRGRRQPGRAAGMLRSDLSNVAVDALELGSQADGICSSRSGSTRLRCLGLIVGSVPSAGVQRTGNTPGGGRERAGGKPAREVCTTRCFSSGLAGFFQQAPEADAHEPRTSLFTPSRLGDDLDVVETPLGPDWRSDLLWRTSCH